MLQVVQVNELFDQIEKLKTSQWQEVCLEIITVYNIKSTIARMSIKKMTKLKTILPRNKLIIKIIDADKTH